jgi:opacity protein-like surface antigen
MKKALALSALAVLGAASVAPAMAGPYLTTKVGAKGEGSDFDKSYIETRVGYETKYGNLKPYIEVGPAWENKDGEDSAETMGQLEIGTKIKLTDNISSKLKAEFTSLNESESDMEWKYEATLTYDF